VGFVVHKVALGQVFSEYFGFHCQFSTIIIIYHPGLVQQDKHWLTYPTPRNYKKESGQGTPKAV
jgi:hypothetical protein